MRLYLSWTDKVVDGCTEEEFVLRMVLEEKFHPRAFLKELNDLYKNDRKTSHVRKHLNDLGYRVSELDLLDLEVVTVTKKPKILIWDIESSDLVADFGFCLCIGYKWYGSDELHIIRGDQLPEWHTDRTNDKSIIRGIYDVLCKADIQVTWYGKRFDYPFVQSRALVHGIGALPPVPHVDGWEIARRKLKLSSNRLNNVQRFLNLPDEKSPVDGRTWVRAYAGYQDAMEYIVEHCQKDVVVLEQAYNVLRPLTIHHPNFNAIISGEGKRCPVCGSENVKPRGYYTTPATKRQRYYCSDCGAWSSEPP